MHRLCQPPSDAYDLTQPHRGFIFIHLVGLPLTCSSCVAGTLGHSPSLSTMPLPAPHRESGDERGTRLGAGLMLPTQKVRPHVARRAGR
jgi:hypothetical protein